MREITSIYLNLNKTYFLVCVITLSFILVYIQQEYIVIPQLVNQPMVNDILRVQILDQFNKYRFLPFLLSPIVLMIRVLFVSTCLYIGGLIFDNLKIVKFVDSFNVALKADIILLFFPVVYSIVIVFYSTEVGLQVIRYTSLIFLFDYEALDPWLIALIGMLNLFELIYWIFIAKLFAIITKTSYRESLNIIVSTYGLGFVFYALFVVFIMLYIFQ